MRTERRAFTLIELMVVITILALLAALLMPMLRGALDRAREEQCKSQLRNMGVAFGGYQGDNNLCIPKASTAAYAGVNDGPFLTWQNALIQGGYLPHGATWYPGDNGKYPLYRTKAFLCPTDPRTGDLGIANDYYMPVVVPDYENFSNDPNRDMSQIYSHTITVGVMDLCYYYNYYDQSIGEWQARTPRSAPMPHMKMNRVGDPAGTMMVIEGLGRWWYAWFDDAWVGDPCAGGVSSGNDLYPSSSYVRRHRKGQNALMCDGSAKWVQVEDTAGAEYSRIFHANKLSWDTIDTWFYDYYGDIWSSSGTLRKATGHGMWSIQVGD